ncbi:mobilization protein [Chryseobacterium indologenes]|uniref:Relaxase/mobilization nuclease domain-containing protein n=2 Tax=Chryseobacterium TaxID=59732 RepID=A0ABY4BE50_9FLAO|nr:MULTISPECIES: relaxase/mobilization nuclease domain-containing protein [Chryseobacterium]UEQ78017.1 relaxase/mobilization nuclease domain-containing protein [Chryseobacterium arthrosphaerae]HCR75612.1 mobilization protein [Chryseobacterium sp.]AYZ35229.1 mobilization protein [Chryseobacterium indologenes]MEB4761444.1 relaxase/mobilization nuclease domain-containing protein [Chryseobacterium indologenes]OCK51404.1 mobilization protein [Chryseobacterium sp. CBo1]
MIIKIMAPAGSGFPGVNYNDKKINEGKGELMKMKNFPSFINKNSNKQKVRDYLKAISNGNKKVLKPQFHAMISTKFQEHSKEELTKIAEDFMDEMGYGKQPFIVIHHNDTENNHVHIVTTRVDKETGKKINDSYEKLNAQQALSDTLEKLYEIKSEEKLNRLLNYKISSIHQLETLLIRNGYKLSKNAPDEQYLTILKNGVTQRTLSENQLVFDNKNDKNRTKQLRAILWKYKNIYSNKVFKVEDFRKQEGMLPEEKVKEKDQLVPKIEFESELQKKLRDVFGIDIVFHHKDEYQPFGYTLIDHKTGSVYKGSEIMKMRELFEFTSEKIDKKLFESLKDYNVRDSESKILLLDFLKARALESELKAFMLFGNKKLKNKEIYNTVRNDVRDYLKTQNNKDINVIKSEDGKYYVIHSRLHYIGEVVALIGEKQYQKLFDPQIQATSKTENKAGNQLNKVVNELFFELMKSSGTAKDPAEDERKKRRKRR